MIEEEEFEHVTQKSKEYLGVRQAVDYNDYCRRFLDWLCNKGKNPKRKKGLAEETAENYLSRVDKFHRWVWEQEEGYTTQITREYADEYVEALATDDLHKEVGKPYSETHKRKEVNALQKLFAWKEGEEDWEPPMKFSDERGRHADLLTRDELREVREAVLKYKTIPRYKSLSPDERDRWKAHLAQRLGKEKSEVSPDDWQRENTSWKFPSLFWTALDAGMRPVEIKRAKISWLRLDKGTVYIPRRESSKNRDNWKVALRDRTVGVFQRWLEEREAYPEYDDTDALWLNRQGNPYNSSTLNSHLRGVLEITDIETENREITWYSIRHSIGTHMTSEGNLAETKEQLRHKSLETTMQYAHPPVEERKDTLDSLG
jgi:site-specific recombinase XerD